MKKLNNMATASLILRDTDNNLIWELIGIKDEVFSGNITVDEMLTEIIDIAKTMLEQWELQQKNSSLTWEKLYLMISMKTYQQ